MANFFKDYQNELKTKRNEQNQTKSMEYTEGQIVYINPMYDKNRNGKRYFVNDLGSGYVLLAENKKDAIKGVGYIYHNSVIVK